MIHSIAGALGHFRWIFMGGLMLALGCSSNQKDPEEPEDGPMEEAGEEADEAAEEIEDQTEDAAEEVEEETEDAAEEIEEETDGDE